MNRIFTSLGIFIFVFTACFNFGGWDLFLNYIGQPGFAVTDFSFK